mgnify:CR=1 FL=1
MHQRWWLHLNTIEDFLEDFLVDFLDFLDFLWDFLVDFLIDFLYELLEYFLGDFDFFSLHCIIFSKIPNKNTAHEVC